MRELVESYLTSEHWLSRVSPRRQVELADFEIAVRPIRFDALFDPYSDTEDVANIDDVCERVDERLGGFGLRLPTEEEFEVACGGSLFWWGDTLPAGDPYSDAGAVPRQNAIGLEFLADSYKTELVRSVFKLGDGGCAVCGGAPWPVAWLSLATAFREWASTDGDPGHADLIAETLEEAYLRPVRL